MKLSKHQREIIQKIYKGEVYDIVSYLQCFNLGHLVRYDENKIEKAFQANPGSKTYYWNKHLKRSKANTISEEEYQSKIEREELHPDYYESASIKLVFNYKNQHVNWNGVDYYYDFYSGVYVAKSIEHILDFLALCQYMKAEMLILEVPCSPSKEMLGLFFEKKPQVSPITSTLNELPIHYETLTIDDSLYLNDEQYDFSTKNCTICSEYIGKKIYPTSKLKLFIAHRFKTAEERAHVAALVAAWVAILISLGTALIPYLKDRTEKQLTIISNDIKEIKSCVETIVSENRPDIDLEPILEKTNITISLLEQINENMADESLSSDDKAK